MKVIVFWLVFSLFSINQLIGGEIVYEVKKGDYLIKIAKKYQVKWRDIYRDNKHQIKNPNLIYPGQRLVIKNVQTEESSNYDQLEYFATPNIQPVKVLAVGDTCSFSFIKKLGIEESDLRTYLLVLSSFIFLILIVSYFILFLKKEKSSVVYLYFRDKEGFDYRLTCKRNEDYFILPYKSETGRKVFRKTHHDAKNAAKGMVESQDPLMKKQKTKLLNQGKLIILSKTIRSISS